MLSDPAAADDDGPEKLESFSGCDSWASETRFAHLTASLSVGSSEILYR
jgi:hypothetical protein